MLLVAHILAGAAIGYKVHNYWLVFILSFISHFIMDAIPHREYDVESLKNGLNRKSFGDFLQVLTDLIIGTGLVLWLTWDSSFITYVMIGMLAAVVPDLLTFFYWQTKTPYLKALTDFHRYTIHPKNNKNTPLIWGISSQIIVAVLAFIGLLF